MSGQKLVRGNLSPQNIGRAIMQVQAEREAQGKPNTPLGSVLAGAQILLDPTREEGWSYSRKESAQALYEQSFVNTFEDLAKAAKLDLSAGARVPWEKQGDAVRAVATALINLGNGE